MISALSLNACLQEINVFGSVGGAEMFTVVEDGVATVGVGFVQLALVNLACSLLEGVVVCAIAWRSTCESTFLLDCSVGSYAVNVPSSTVVPW